MRTEQQMFDLILNTARQDDRIRAVYLNGSRANPHAPKDLFQDYDVVYVVTELASFLADPQWIARFGALLVAQQPDQLDAMLGKTVDLENRYAYLMQFVDGNRIDLTLQSVAQMRKEYGTDSLTVPLLDKDGLLKPIPPADDRSYLIERPTKEQFYHACNEFWWLSPYLAKGLWREEVLYTLDNMNAYWRPQLFKLLCYVAGLQTEFTVSAGKSGKYLHHYLDQTIWKRYLQTFSAADKAALWQATMTGCALFQELASLVADGLAFSYDTQEGVRVMSFLSQVQTMPRNATTFYE